MVLRLIAGIAFVIFVLGYFSFVFKNSSRGIAPEWVIGLAFTTIFTIYFTFINTGDVKAKLIKAADKGDIPTVRKMLEKKKAKKAINKMGANGNRLLHYAAGEWKEPDLVEKIIRMGAEVDIPNIWKRTPLHEAAEVNNLEAMKILLEHGADIHHQDIHQVTPLTIVKKKNKKKTLELFEKFGAETGSFAHD